MVCPPFPVKPIVATIPKFTEYSKQKQEYDRVVNLKGTTKKELV